jgi:hypothetical protein
MSVLHHELLEAISFNFSPIGSGSSRSRIRYSCIDVSENFLVLGANTGSLYFYERNTLTFLQLLTLVQEPIVQVRFSPNERLLAVATSKNYTILVIEPNLISKKEKERVIVSKLVIFIPPLLNVAFFGIFQSIIFSFSRSVYRKFTFFTFCPHYNVRIQK